MSKIHTVSIVMCTFNGVNYLKEQLDSILHQTYPIFELIIQDDGSTDGTIDLLIEYMAKNTCIKLFINEEHQGINNNFYSAIKRAKGEYIAISDQDDLWELNKIENQLKTIGDNWLSCGFSKPFNNDNIEIYFDNRVPNLNIERLIYIASSTPGHTMLFRRNFVSLVPQEFDFILYDHLFSIVAAYYNKISFVEKVLVNHREHINSATYTSPVMKRGGNNRSIGNLLKSLFRTISLYFKLRNHIQEYFSKMNILLNRLPNMDSQEHIKKISFYQSKKGGIAYLRLTLLCIKFRRNLFYIVEPNDLLTFLRSIYFPISCSDYFRYML